MEEPNLTITISGKAGAGKSRLTYIIKCLLEDWDFSIDFDGGTDFDNEKHFDTFMSIELEKALERIKQKGDVKLVEVQTKRSID